MNPESDSGESDKDEELDDVDRVMSTNNDDDDQENDQPDEAEHL